jgi:DNA-binding IclR family transcriptional regulator
MLAITCLGRHVLPEDWMSIQKDRILRALYNVGQSNAGIELSDLASLTGLEPDKLQKLLDGLITSDLIFPERHTYRLTIKGLDRVCSFLPSAP